MIDQSTVRPSFPIILHGRDKQESDSCIATTEGEEILEKDVLLSSPVPLAPLSILFALHAYRTDVTFSAFSFFHSAFLLYCHRRTLGCDLHRGGDVDRWRYGRS